VLDGNGIGPELRLLTSLGRESGTSIKEKKRAQEGVKSLPRQVIEGPSRWPEHPRQGEKGKKSRRETLPEVGIGGREENAKGVSSVQWRVLSFGSGGGGGWFGIEKTDRGK